jgi:hypothetical protein
MVISSSNIPRDEPSEWSPELLNHVLMATKGTKYARIDISNLDETLPTPPPGLKWVFNENWQLTYED